MASGRGLSLKTKVKIILGIAAFLTGLVLYVFYPQQFIQGAMWIMGIAFAAFLLYFFFRSRPARREGHAVHIQFIHGTDKKPRKRSPIDPRPSNAILESERSALNSMQRAQANILKRIGKKSRD